MRGERGIRADEAGRVADLGRHNADDTARIEAEARARSLSAEKQQTRAIQSEYEERLRQYGAELDQQLISQDDFNRRVAAAGQERDAQMVEAAKQAREKMAGEFTRFFKNPLDAMKEMGEKAAGETAAALFQRVQSHGSTGATPGFNDQWSLGKIFDRVAGKSPGAANAQDVRRSESISSGAFTLAHAEIRVGTANISMPAGAATGTPYSSSGSTSLLAAPGRVSQGGSTTDAALGAGAAGKGGAPSFSGTAQGGGPNPVSNTLGDVRQGVRALKQAKSIFAPGASDSGSDAGSGDEGSAADFAQIPGLSGKGGAPSFSGTAEGGGPNPVGSALSDVNQGIGAFKEAKSIFAPGGGAGASNDGGGASGISNMLTGGDNGSPFQIGEEPMQTLDVPGKSVTSGFGASLMGGGGISALSGAAGGVTGLYSAYQGNGGVGGALGGAMSGMELGMAVGGPVGAAVGLAAGAIIGAIGFGGREKGRVYDLKTVRPRLTGDFMSYQEGSMDYTSAYSDMESLDAEARKTLDKMGGSARGYYWDTINKEIHQAEAKLTGEQRAGRSKFTATAAQYDQGGWTGDFGAMTTGSDTGWAHMRKGEFVVQEQPAATHAGALEAIRAGASHTDMARYYGLDDAAGSYRSAMQPDGGRSSAASSSLTHNWTVNAIDAKSFRKLLYDEKHTLRGALNASYAENSGGADGGY